MSYLDTCERSKGAAGFGFAVEKTHSGWRWIAFDPAGRVAEEGEAATKAEAAALVIRAHARS